MNDTITKIAHQLTSAKGEYDFTAVNRALGDFIHSLDDMINHSATREVEEMLEPFERGVLVFVGMVLHYLGFF